MAPARSVLVTGAADGIGRGIATRFASDGDRVALLDYDPVSLERTTAALGSPHTIVLYDFGTTREGAFYYVMELLNGVDLKTLVEKFGPQTPERTTYLLRQVCHSQRAFRCL